MVLPSQSITLAFFGVCGPSPLRPPDDQFGRWFLSITSSPSMVMMQAHWSAPGRLWLIVVGISNPMCSPAVSIGGRLSRLPSKFERSVSSSEKELVAQHPEQLLLSGPVDVDAGVSRHWATGRVLVVALSPTVLLTMAWGRCRLCRVPTRRSIYCPGWGTKRWAYLLSHSFISSLRRF